MFEALAGGDWWERWHGEVGVIVGVGVINGGDPFVVIGVRAKKGVEGLSGEGVGVELIGDLGLVNVEARDVVVEVVIVIGENF